ncbi:hypothetical protein Hanom_Chr10g00958851 [Helianthus anomalus]
MSNSDDPHSPTLKSDFSMITQIISRQLHTVVSFLAPPPPHQPSYSHDASPSSSSYQGLKNDLAEIGDSLKTLLSPKKAVTGISKFASNLIKFDKGYVVGVTDDVVDFVRQISTRPEYFNMSHVQNDHALAIQGLVPNLTTLRHTIHNHMTEQQFWIIYFVLLVPRLNADDYRLLTNPQIVRVRETVLQKLSNNKNMPTGCSCSDDTHDEKGSMVNSTEQSENPFQEAATNWKSEDDVSVSDLDDETSSGVKRTQSCRFSSASESSDWVRLGGTSKVKRCERRSESEESSSTWHAVEDVDL